MLPKRSSTIVPDAANILDKSLDCQDDSKRESQTSLSVGPYMPQRKVILYLTLNRWLIDSRLRFGRRSLGQMDDRASRASLCASRIGVLMAAGAVLIAGSLARADSGDFSLTPGDPSAVPTYSIPAASCATV